MSSTQTNASITCTQWQIVSESARSHIGFFICGERLVDMHVSKWCMQEKHPLNTYYFGSPSQNTRKAKHSFSREEGDFIFNSRRPSERSVFSKLQIITPPFQWKRRGWGEGNSFFSAFLSFSLLHVIFKNPAFFTFHRPPPPGERTLPH